MWSHLLTSGTADATVGHTRVRDERWITQKTGSSRRFEAHSILEAQQQEEEAVTDAVGDQGLGFE